MTLEEAPRRAGRRRRRARPRRLRVARVGGEDPRVPRRARGRDPVPRHLPRHARRRVRVRPPRRAASTAPTRPRWTRRRRTPVIDLLPEQKEVEDLGGTMRLGAQAVELHEGTHTREVYGGEPVIAERHRHRYEVNNALPPAAASMRGSSSAAPSRRAGSWRSSSCPSIRGSSPRSSTRSSSRGRPGLRRSSASSSPPRSTARARERTSRSHRPLLV